MKTIEELSIETRQMIHSYLVSASIIRAGMTNSESRAQVEMFDNELRKSSRYWDHNLPVHDLYKLFFDWLRNGDHDEKLFNIFDHARAFKNFVTLRSRPSMQKPKTAAPVKRDPNRININDAAVIRGIKTMWEMDNFDYEQGTIGNRAQKSGGRWTEGKIYQRYLREAQRRGLYLDNKYIVTVESTEIMKAV